MSHIDSSRLTHRRRLLRAALLCGASAGLAPAWAINKCTSADGKTIYQDQPCAPGQGGAIEVHPASGAHNEQAAIDVRARTARMERDSRVAVAINTHEPIVGMTVRELESAMGLATQVNADTSAGHRREQVIYERQDATWYVYTQDGVVQAVQHRPRAPQRWRERGGAASPTPCPTQHEINDAITSAGSISLSADEKAARWRAIREMQACGR